MANEILFMDGFEHYANDDILKKWNGFVFSTTYHTPNNNDIAMRFATNGTLNSAMKVAANNSDKEGRLTKSITTTNRHVTYGMALWIEDAASTQPEPIASLGVNSDGDYIRFELDGAGEIDVYSGATKITSTTTMNIPSQTWFYMEVEVDLDSSASGFVKIYKNGTLEHTFNGVTDVQPHNEDFSLVGGCYIMGPVSVSRAGTCYWDDLYVKNDGPLGDVRVITLIPESAGASTGFTPNTGSNFDAVNETDDIDDDTTYVENGTVGALDLYNIDTFTTTPTTIHGIQTNVTCKKTDAALRQMQPVIRISSTNYNGDTVTVGSSYKDELEIWEQNPNTSSAWTPADIGNLQIGFKVTT